MGFKEGSFRCGCDEYAACCRRHGFHMMEVITIGYSFAVVQKSVRTHSASWRVVKVACGRGLEVVSEARSHDHGLCLLYE